MVKRWKIAMVAALACALALVVCGCGTSQKSSDHALEEKAFPFKVLTSDEEGADEGTDDEGADEGADEQGADEGTDEQGAGEGTDEQGAGEQDADAGDAGEQGTDKEEINLYFVDGGEVPYVSLEEYLPFVGSTYENEANGLAAVEYDVKVDGDIAMVTRADNGASMGVDAQANVLSFGDYDAFIMQPGDTTMMGFISPANGESTGLNSLFKDAGMSYEHAGEVLIIDLSDYSMDIVVQDGQAYLPLQTVNDVLLANRYVQVVFNGQEVLASGFDGDLQDKYKAPTGKMSDELATFNYNELRLLLDNFYGLAPEHGIDGFAEYFADTGLLEDLMGTDPQAFDTALAKLLSLYLDDSHSGLTQPSYLSGEDAMSAISEELSAGASTIGNAIVTKTAQVQRARYNPETLVSAVGGDSTLSYEEVGDTAIITFDSFAATKEDYRNDADLKNPQDTIELIAAAHKQITRKNSPIKNVVMDISCNGGGQAPAAVFAIAWFKRVAQVALRDTRTGAQSVCSYLADINLDGEFDENDYLPSDLNLYCLMSQASFSCGNLVPTAFKGSANVMLLGRASGGGACVVLPATTAIGSVFQISGTTQIGTLLNGSFYSADTGVDPDFTLAKWDTFYDREALVDYIHGLK